MSIPKGHIKTIACFAEGIVNEKHISYVGFVDQYTLGNGFMFNLILTGRLIEGDDKKYRNIQIHKDQFLTLQTAKNYFKCYSKNIKGKAKYKEIPYNEKNKVMVS